MLTLFSASLVCRPNVCTFNATLSACENASAWQKAQELLVARRWTPHIEDCDGESLLDDLISLDF